MNEHILQAQREYWNRQFDGERRPPTTQSHWLDTFTKKISTQLYGPTLEIGCGGGYDTRFLLDAGCHLTCLDLSWNALQQVAQVSRSAQLVNAALPDPLPFRSATFALVIAGLSLHYFPRRDTLTIIEEIGRVLQPRGTLIFRVNSTEDVAHGAGRGEEIEPNLYYHEGRYKRFFTEEMCRELFDDSWAVETLIPWVERRWADPKPTWMGVVHRR
jgi:SAM-dependent methyltransferase